MGRKTTEIRLLPPRRVALSAELERDAVAVLAELLLDVARQRASGSGLDGGSGGAIGGGVSLPARAGKARKAA